MFAYFLLVHVECTVTVKYYCAMLSIYSCPDIGLYIAHSILLQDDSSRKIPSQKDHCRDPSGDRGGDLYLFIMVQVF